MTNRTVVVITGAPAWANDVQSLLQADYTIKHYPQRERYVFRLTDDRAAMILVDGTGDDWLFWAATLKSSPATRRIPVVFASDDLVTQAEALKSGADVALTPAELLEQLPALIEEHAYTPDPTQQEQLTSECDEPLPPLAVQGVEKFNNREFYPQHDLFEEQWVETDGPVRDLYRAVLQVGVAYYQIERGNHRGALKMLLRATQWLEVLPDVCQTINVGQLRQDAYAVRAELERMNPDDINQFDRTLLRPVQRVLE